MSEFRPVPRRKERLGDIIYGQILDRITAGALKPGDKLPSENEICRSSQVSRPTVREALMRLHADGLVVTRQGSGTYVQHRPSEHLTRLAKASDIAELLRCFEVRLGLESQAAGLAAQRRTPAEVEAIFAALDALRAAFARGSVPARTDFAFHLAVAAASGNPLFGEILETLNETIQEMMGVALGITRAGSQERARRVFDEHEAIAEAIRQGDAEAATLTMRYHLHRARQRLTDGQRDQ
ncbi:FadR/GntR family transcriptional regulator [Lichenibacterium ramalinae]|uniref:FadR family transcriptional regulator n=1 Tax=Lichenibacterium ramalinae TaxID=2316527 RepID=A0A4Q2RAK5_9HYPH|nr:FadR/GntR family transcriptional regulator [Lichenibacterium ramalinae]RYB02656.1 FadR family transcriptional regulator [Lichenibacterium ramalinae]